MKIIFTQLRKAPNKACAIAIDVAHQWVLEFKHDVPANKVATVAFLKICDTTMRLRKELRAQAGTAQVDIELDDQHDDDRLFAIIRIRKPLDTGGDLARIVFQKTPTHSNA